VWCEVCSFELAVGLLGYALDPEVAGSYTLSHILRLEIRGARHSRKCGSKRKANVRYRYTYLPKVDKDLLIPEAPKRPGFIRVCSRSAWT